MLLPLLLMQSTLVIGITDTGGGYLGELVTFQSLVPQGTYFSQWVGHPIGSHTMYSMLWGQVPLVQNGYSCTGTATGIPLATLSAAEMAQLQQPGIATAWIGKWGLGTPQEGLQFRTIAPQLHGYETWRAGICSNVGNYTDWERIDDGAVSQETQWADEAIADAACDYLSTATGEFFAVVWFSGGHGPFGQAAPASALPPGYQVEPGIQGRYRSILAAADEGLRRIISQVDLTETYVVIAVTSGVPDKQSLMLPGMDVTRVKRSLYEGGLKHTLLMLGPGIPAGDTNAGLHASQDLWAYLFGQQTPTSTYTRTQLGFRFQDTERVVREEQFKLIDHSGVLEFYQLPDEQTPLPQVGADFQRLWGAMQLL